MSAVDSVAVSLEREREDVLPQLLRRRGRRDTDAAALPAASPLAVISDERDELTASSVADVGSRRSAALAAVPLRAREEEGAECFQQQQ